jgi:hypothetical protein
VALKRKSNATDPEAKYKKLVSDAGKIWFDWDVSNDSLIDFKRAAIDAIRRLDNKQFATHAQAKDEEERLGWLVSVPHGGIFAEKNKTMLDDAVFPDFLDQIDGPRDGRIKYTITLVESDPKLIAQVSFNALQNLSLPLLTFALTNKTETASSQVLRESAW